MKKAIKTPKTPVARVYEFACIPGRPTGEGRPTFHGEVTFDYDGRKIIKTGFHFVPGTAEITFEKLVDMFSEHLRRAR